MSDYQKLKEKHNQLLAEYRKLKKSKEECQLLNDTLKTKNKKLEKEIVELQLLLYEATKKLGGNNAK